MKDYLIKEDVFMALTGDITDCTIEEFIARLRDKLSRLPSVNAATNYDCISRQAVLDVMKKHWLAGTVAHRVIDEIGLSINVLPSVTPKKKAGHWIKVTNGRGGHECDLCHEYAPSYRSSDEYLTKYCPNCGAKMVEPQESEM